MVRITLGGVAVALILLTACSSTTVIGSWRNPGFSGAVEKVYIVGIARQELNRRIFEDEFGRRLQELGVTGIASYGDLPDPRDADKETIAERVRQQRADSLLMVRMVGKRTEEVVNPGWVSYGYGYGYTHPYAPDYTYRQWGSYYDRCCFVTTYEPPTITQYEVATIEANLYDASSGELIWGAQLDTVINADTQALIADFADTVIKELIQQRLL